MNYLKVTTKCIFLADGSLKLKKRALAMIGRGGRPVGVEDFEGAAAVHAGGQESSLATVHSAGAQVRRC